ncbi:hypothetical protein Skr01_02540 [Sphaerisporangium krabiense]|uniref:Uncharacterized protein n=1 Tax=Sphaerisporangium krabiense TaxID=763782 RepID=A0A7W8Z7V4_9ACTN|nr:hypothetical protein [Sphaerisporangium krabiense]MBB5628991.1 hypothetical protein [Sphaerisporangium krabiense]GII60169.1 hypothetical protein Skr01_02540 [Sphaerisporangium krabiense]
MSEETTRKRAARRFDIRRIIGGLFAVYGVILTITGLLDGQAELAKAEGVRINLWTGLSMIAVGIAFITWEHLRPYTPPPPEDPDDRP